MNLQERNNNIEQLFGKIFELSDDNSVLHSYTEEDSVLPPYMKIYHSVKQSLLAVINSGPPIPPLFVRQQIMWIIKGMAIIGAHVERQHFMHKYDTSHEVMFGMKSDWFVLTNCWYALVNKGKDYAGENDAYRNFKETAEIVGITPRQTLLAYAYKQFTVIAKYLEGDDFNTFSDSLSERIADVINYMAILYFMYPNVPDNQPELFPEA